MINSPLSKLYAHISLECSLKSRHCELVLRRAQDELRNLVFEHQIATTPAGSRDDPLVCIIGFLGAL